MLKNHSKDLFLDKESTTFIRGEVQQSVEEQMSQNVGKIADKACASRTVFGRFNGNVDALSAVA